MSCGVELVGSLCAQLCSVHDSTARPYPLPSPTTIPRPIALFVGWLHYNWVRRATIGSGALQLGQSHYYQVGCAIIGLVVLLSGLAGALSLHVLFHSFACSSPPLPAKV